MEAIIKGVNLAIAWQLQEVNIRTDSATVFSWLRSLLEKDKPIKARGLGEALTRRRLSIIADTLFECNLVASVSLVRSEENKADQLTRVPQGWLKPSVCHQVVAAAVEVKPDLVAFHDLHHLGTNRTLYLARKSYPDAKITRKQVEAVVKNCSRCCSIDPAPVSWTPGSADVSDNWQRLAIDVTHFRSKKYLTLIDCGPSKFAIWREIPNEGESVISRHLNEIFRERGPPGELLMDNATSFRSLEVRKLCESWGVEPVYRCAYRPSGNGIIERNHRTIKRSAARTGKDVLTAVYWYNVSPCDGIADESVPYRRIYTYEWKPLRLHTATTRVPTNSETFRVGQKVFVKPPGARCTTQWPLGTVSAPIDGVGIEVDGIRRHIADLRVVPSVSEPAPADDGANSERGDVQETLHVAEHNPSEEDANSQLVTADSDDGQLQRLRPRDTLRPPMRLADYVLH